VGRRTESEGVAAGVPVEEAVDPEEVVAAEAEAEAVVVVVAVAAVVAAEAVASRPRNGETHVVRPPKAARGRAAGTRRRSCGRVPL
jgi:hypothetical protein